MDQELKQRLIGAAVITALAAIFVPMLFDDPVDETGKSVNELKLPELPAKVQDVEIMPLPDKTEEVIKPEESGQKSVPAFGDEGEAEAELPPSRPRLRLPARDNAVVDRPQTIIEPDEGDIHADADAEAEDLAPVAKTSRLPAAPVTPAPQQAAKTLKPAAKAPVPEKSSEPAAEAASGSTRWYLNAGTFSKKANAQNLQDSLKQQGFAASIKEVAGEKGTVYKVRIGPMLDRAKAQAVKNKLTQINVNSFVAPDE